MNVLIVDDSAAIRKILQRVLKLAGLPLAAVHEAGDGLEALEIAKAQSLDLIFSDINMPNMDGLQFLGKLKSDEGLKKVPVIMVGTEGSQTKVLEAVQLGAAGYIRKPFTPDQIKDKVVGVF